MLPLSGTLLFYLLAHLRSIARISPPKRPEYAAAKKNRLEDAHATVEAVLSRLANGNDG
jgi:hypothetical protein